MKQINIKREGGTVKFDTVSIDVTETVFFTNLDPGLEIDPGGSGTHWPCVTDQDQPLSDNELGPYPSPNSSQCTVPALAAGQTAFTYGCKFHPLEQGTINVFAQLAAVNLKLPQATVNKLLPDNPPLRVVIGGKSPYAITGQIFQVTDNQGNVIESGSDSIGPGLQLNPDPTDKSEGICVTGKPTVVGTYNFTFTVDDAMGRNLQQVQYSMDVALPGVA